MRALAARVAAHLILHVAARQEANLQPAVVVSALSVPSVVKAVRSQRQKLNTEGTEKSEGTEAGRAIIAAMPRTRKRSTHRATAKTRRPDSRARFQQLSAELADIGRHFYERGWVLGTSGNLSAVVSENPLRMAITSTGLDKSALALGHFLEIDDSARVLRGEGKPSAETGLHLAIVRTRGAGAVLHTHSLWSTLLSHAHAASGALTIEGFEMLKGLEGVHTHEHRETLPIFENSQDIPALAAQVEEKLAANPRLHGFLLRRHGLYTWGRTLAEAKRHVEILEFLLEAVGRSASGLSGV